MFFFSELSKNINLSIQIKMIELGCFYENLINKLSLFLGFRCFEQQTKLKAFSNIIFKSYSKQK